MKLRCPVCSAELEGEVAAGEIVDCPACGQSFEAKAPSRIAVVSAPAARTAPQPAPKLRGLAVRAFLLHIFGSRYGWKAEDEISKARGALSTGDVTAARQHAETARDMIRHGCLVAGLVFLFLLLGLAGFVYAIVT